MLGWLGDRVTGPVLDHLGYTTTPPAGGPWPRVWWCPSGALSLLPIHAAGHHHLSDGPSDAVIDRVISSTVPTVRALLHARQAPPPAGEPRVLVVAMPHTPGQADLPGAAEEAGTFERLLAGRVDVLGLPGTAPATYDSVTAALPHHSWVHFSCHGESDPTDPSASHLLLADYRTRPLTVVDLTEARLQGGELAFLSACTTARTGDHLCSTSRSTSRRPASWPATATSSPRCGRSATPTPHCSPNASTKSSQPTLISGRRCGRHGAAPRHPPIARPQPHPSQPLGPLHPHRSMTHHRLSQPQMPFYRPIRRPRPQQPVSAMSRDGCQPRAEQRGAFENPGILKPI